jgi:hypothetical protein
MNSAKANSLLDQCLQQLLGIDGLSNRLDEKWMDCKRLCGQCTKFRPCLEDLLLTKSDNFVHETKLEELYNFFQRCEKFLNCFSGRKIFRGTTNIHFQQKYVTDIATLSAEIDQHMKKWYVEDIELSRSDLIEV